MLNTPTYDGSDVLSSSVGLFLMC